MVPLQDNRTFYDFLTVSQAFAGMFFQHREVFGQVCFETGGWDSDFPDSMLEILRAVMANYGETQRLIGGGANQLPHAGVATRDRAIAGGCNAGGVGGRAGVEWTSGPAAWRPMQKTKYPELMLQAWYYAYPKKSLRDERRLLNHWIQFTKLGFFTLDESQAGKAQTDQRKAGRLRHAIYIFDNRYIIKINFGEVLIAMYFKNCRSPSGHQTVE